MRFPGLLPTGYRVKNRIQLLDITTTVCDLLGVEAPQEAQGNSFKPLLLGEPPTEKPVYTEALLYFGEKKSVQTGPFKLVKTFATDRYELYDTAQDPEETANLASLHPSLVDSLARMLEAWQDSSGAIRQALPRTAGGSMAVIDPDLEARLKAMGYLQ